MSIRGTDERCPSVLSLARLRTFDPRSGDAYTAVALSVAAASSYIRAVVWCIPVLDPCIWPAVCSPFHVISYASLGDLSVRLLRGYEGLESSPLVLYRNITRRCCCLLYTRHLRYTRLLNLARGGLSMSRVSYASMLICPYCCLEDTRYSNLFRTRHCSRVCTALEDTGYSNLARSTPIFLIEIHIRLSTGTFKPMPYL